MLIVLWKSVWILLWFDLDLSSGLRAESPRGHFVSVFNTVTILYWASYIWMNISFSRFWKFSLKILLKYILCTGRYSSLSPMSMIWCFNCFLISLHACNMFWSMSSSPSNFPLSVHQFSLPTSCILFILHPHQSKCYPHVHRCRTICWSMGSLSEIISLKKLTLCLPTAIHCQ